MPMEILYTYSWVPVLAAIFILVPYLVLLLKRAIVWIVKRLSGAAEREHRASEALHLRYRTPDWNFFEQHLCRDVPPSITRLYTDFDIGMWPMMKLKDREAGLCPIDKKSLSSGTTELLGHEVVPLAFDDCGQAIYLKPGINTPDIVYVYDAGVEEILFQSVDDYVEALRLSGANLSFKRDAEKRGAP